MHNKQKIIKSGLLTFSSVLVLIIATVAWFTSGSQSGLDGFISEIESEGYGAGFFESIDGNDPWVKIDESNLNITGMVPGEKHFYMIEVTATQPSINFFLAFKSVTVTYPTGYTFEQKVDVLGRISVDFEATDKAGNPIGTNISESLLDFFGKTDPDLLDVFLVYNGLLLTNDVDENPTKIYYTIGIDGGTDDHGDDILEGVEIDIGTIDLSIT